MARRRASGTACIVFSVLVGCAGDGHITSEGLEARLQRVVDQYLADRSVPGISVAVVIDGDIYRAIGGLADVENGRKVGIDDEFRLASVTKNYVAALAVDLASDGVVGLDDTTGRWLPDLPSALEPMRDVTLRQLLSHTSGLAQTYTDDRDRGRVLSTNDVLARIPPPVCEPDRCWSYADGNYVLAGLMLEAATGLPIATLMDDRFFDPLELTHTRFIDERSADVVPQYILAVDATGTPFVPHQFRRQLLPFHGNDAAGGMQASATDLARWGDALFRARATSADVVRALLDIDAMRDLPCPNQCPYQYGLGTYHYTIDGTEFVGHDGSSGAVLVHDIDRATTIAIVTNGSEHATDVLLRAILAALG